MKITDVQIDGFGIWSNLAVRKLSGDVSVFYGPNEAGKTTLMQFIRTVLYGFSRERRGRYLPPVHGGQPGGVLDVDSLRGGFQVRRHIGAGDAPESLGDLILLDEGGSPQGTHQLSSILGGVDESIFTNVFAIGLREMQELGALNDSAAADHLYKLTSGLDRVSLIDVVRDLADARCKLLSRDERPSELTNLVVRRDKLRAEIDELATRGRRWPQLVAERQERTREIEQVEQSISDTQRQTHHFELLLSIREKWTQRRHVEEQLAGMGGAAELPADALEQLEQANARLKTLKRRLHACRKQRTELREEHARHVYHKPLLAQAARIQALGEHAPWIGSLEEEVARLASDVSSLEKEVEARRPQIDVPAGTPRAKLPEITPKTLALLRGPATRLNHLSKLVDRVQQEAIAVKSRSDQALQRVSSELQDLDESSLSAALEKAGSRVAHLRRRIQIEERLEQLTLQHNELEGQSNELFDWQVMPFDKMAWLFASFVFSTVLILGGVFGGLLWGFSWFLGLLLTFMGFVGLGASIVWKLDWERNAEREWQSCERQLEMLEQQVNEAKAERDQLDQQLPSGGGPLDARLAAAERQLQQLEQLAPMDAQRHESGQHVDAAERRAAKVAEELKEARRNWQTALKSAGLPETLAPQDVRHLARSFRGVLSVRKQLTHRRDELEARRRELAALAGRISEMFVELGLQPESESAQAQLRQLAASLAEQQKIAERRREVQQQLKQLQARWRKTVHGYEVTTRNRKALLAKANAADETQLRRMVAQQHQAQLLRTQREELTHQMRATIGDAWTEEALAREFNARGEDTPEQKRARLVDRTQELKAAMSRLHEERGQLGAEMKAMLGERRLDEAKLELGCVEQRIAEAMRHWQVLSVTGLLLESVRGIYETTRQPETLREASTYLQRLTQGQYTRIWTPIEEKVLRVEDSKGVSLSLDKLSSGTREGVFLSLRLALVAGYARRGAKLPLILDDVLVNFDTGRVRAAATVLRDFARQGHQMLLFTCHEHIMQIFKSVGADIRLLPGREGSFAEQPVEEHVEQPAPAPAPAPVPQPKPKLPAAEVKPERRPLRRRPVERRREPIAPRREVVERPAAVVPVIEEPIATVVPVVEDHEEPTIPFPTPYTALEIETEIEEIEEAVAEHEPTLPPVPAPVVETPVQSPKPMAPMGPTASGDRGLERRFTWDSPEVYWQERDEVA